LPKKVPTDISIVGKVDTVNTRLPADD
jgi:hypothetical protein